MNKGNGSRVHKERTLGDERRNVNQTLADHTRLSLRLVYKEMYYFKRFKIL